MLRLLSRTRLTSPSSMSPGCFIRSNVVHFSSDSHDDFKPKKRVIPDGLDEVRKLIDEQVKGSSVMLYMKGTQAKPQCGFSQQAVRILNAVGVDIDSVNILEHPLIRQEMKNYSDWPTFPQLFIKGEFIGGCDIMTAMFNDGSLEKLLKEKNLIK